MRSLARTSSSLPLVCPSSPGRRLQHHPDGAGALGVHGHRGICRLVSRTMPVSALNRQVPLKIMHSALRHLLSLSLAICVTAASAENVPTDDSFRILVTSIDHAWQYSFNPHTESLLLLPGTTEKLDEKGHLEIVGTMNQESLARAKARTAAADQMTATLGSRPRWALFSPDCRYVLTVSEPVLAGALLKVTLGTSRPWQAIKEFKLEDFALQDFAWSEGSEYLLLVESEERYSKSPMNWFRSLAGHPVPLETLFITIVQTATGESKRIRLAEDLPFGMALIYGASSRCAYSGS